MPKIIFHIPMKIDRTRVSASQIRPFKIIHAFKVSGYDIDIVEGYGAERRQQIAEIKRNVRRGVKYDFLYSESSTMPTLLTEKNHLPLYPFLDFSFFAFCKKHRIKIGLFYRDIYWCFTERGHESGKQRIARYFYRYDLKRYAQLVDVLFLPSYQMLKHIPFHFPMRVEELPSGLDLKFVNNLPQDLIHILYVGGIGEHYILEMITRVVSGLSHVKLTICCRQDEWEGVKEEYQSYLSNRITILHAGGEELEKLYQEANLFNLFVEPLKYWEFAAPFKLFEAIGHGCPVLASNGTWVADFLKKQGGGYVCEYNEAALKELLSNLSLSELEEKREIVKTLAKRNTWSMRCEQIRNALNV